MVVPERVAAVLPSYTLLETVSVAVTSFLFTVNDTLNVCALILPFDAVTVAVWVPAASPVFGVTVKLPVASKAMEVTVPGDTVNEPEWLPLNATVRSPVASYPALVTVTAAAERSPAT